MSLKYEKLQNGSDIIGIAIEGVGKKIIVDDGGFFEYKVLYALGVDISGSQFTERDGKFPDHIPNPENKEAMESKRNAVLENKAELAKRYSDLYVWNRC